MIAGGDEDLNKGDTFMTESKQPINIKDGNKDVGQTEKKLSDYMNPYG